MDGIVLSIKLQLFVLNRLGTGNEG
jgi:hypothetical protein